MALGVLVTGTNSANSVLRSNRANDRGVFDVRSAVGPELLRRMRDAFFAGGNAMDAARCIYGSAVNSLEAVEIAYDPQAGSYTRDATENPLAHELWTHQFARFLGDFLRHGDSVVEVGCGDGPTLGGVLHQLDALGPFGVIDLSWSRTATARRHLAELGVHVNLAIGDMFHLPLPCASVDVVVTSHAIEPNGGRELEAISESLRVTRRHLILFEPLYEFASAAARDRRVRHGYIRELLTAASEATGSLIDAGPLSYSTSALNPSGSVVIDSAREPDHPGSAASADAQIAFARPLTGEVLVRGDDHLFAPAVGLAHPRIEGIPVLRPEYAVLVSAP